jgi:hypothetical protein
LPKILTRFPTPQTQKNEPEVQFPFTPSTPSNYLRCEFSINANYVTTFGPKKYIRGPSYIATTLSPSGAPAIKSNPVISDNIVAFVGSNGNIQYVTVPMQGDVDQDGVVNQTDKTDVTNCLNQVLKGAVC